MDHLAKRKSAPTGSDVSPSFKKKKAANKGKWQTPQQKIRSMRLQRGTVEAGDVGIWATCARSMEGKAARELQLLLDEYAEKMYNIKPEGKASGSDEDEATEDIEAAIRKELSALQPAAMPGGKRIFTPIRIDAECVLFTKTQAPVDPVDLVYRICRDAVAHPGGPERKTRYLNRLTPVTLNGKANEKSLEETAKRVLKPWFKLRQDESDPQAETTDEPQSKPAYSYAIRVTARYHTAMKRDDVIKKIASLIHDRHKVNLGAPDKVILVEIYQMACGMSVVDGDWGKLKKFNLTELYSRETDKSQVDEDRPETVDKPKMQTDEQPARE